MGWPIWTVRYEALACCPNHARADAAQYLICSYRVIAEGAAQRVNRTW
jgi:hypothetical protein